MKVHVPAGVDAPMEARKYADSFCQTLLPAVHFFLQGDTCGDSEVK